MCCLEAVNNHIKSRLRIWKKDLQNHKFFCMQIGTKNFSHIRCNFFFKSLIVSTGPSGSYILYRSWDFNVMCENVFEFDGGLTCTCQEFDLGCGVSMPLT